MGSRRWPNEVQLVAVLYIRPINYLLWAVARGPGEA